MAISIFTEHMPALFSLVNPGETLSPTLSDILEASYTYSRMLHASNSPMGGGAIESGGFYRAYTPTIGSQLDPTQLGKSFETPFLTSAQSLITSFVVQSSSKNAIVVNEVCRRNLAFRTPQLTYVDPPGEPERVGACLFPGLVKESALDNTPMPMQATSLRVGPGGMGVGAASQQILKKKRETRRVVVRRAQVICE